MTPSGDERDIDYFSQDITPSLNKPPPAFSSSTSPGSEYGTSNLRIDANPSIASVPRLNTPNHVHRLNGSRDRSASPTSTSQLSNEIEQNDLRNLIIQSFAPRVALYASTDSNELVSAKGFRDGLSALLGPFGEHVSGKVVVRDSHGLSKAWEDFGIRIFDPEYTKKKNAAQSSAEISPESREPRALPTGLETILDRYLDNHGVTTSSISPTGTLQALHREGSGVIGGSSRIYEEYLKVLLSSSPVVPYESFNHPVACLVAVSSRNAAPIETLRQLYAMTGRANPNNPVWMGTEYLRYYVLIHDEDHDDISKSTALFDLMKRHFGLHCHLLRLRTIQCAATDDDSVPLPHCHWLSTEERQAISLHEDNREGLDESGQFLFESDVSAVNALIREMVTQSIIPFMENRVMAWNDQVASRRRGIGGRFMSMSKRWAGFGSSKASNSAGGGNSGSSGSNFNSRLGFYPPETPEAIMRSLADYCTMLRDWRLAHSTYDFVRSDYNHDKAWAYHAAANEMSAVTALLMMSTQARARPENIDQWLEAATYSYLTRCSSPLQGKRCLVLATELLHNRSDISGDRASVWTGRLLEFAVLGPVEQALITDRSAEHYQNRAKGTSSTQHFSKRHSALWAFVASRCWARLDRSSQATSRLEHAQGSYSRFAGGKNLPFPSMQALWDDLSSDIGAETNQVEVSDELISFDDDGHEGDKFAQNGQDHLDAFVAESGPGTNDLVSGDFHRRSVSKSEGRRGFGLQSDGFE